MARKKQPNRSFDCEQGGLGKYGPPLWGLFGREAGTGDLSTYAELHW